MKSLSLYIHIPFCVSKCYYCDFSSFANMEDKIEDYMNSLIIELELYKEKLKDYYIKTIFIGGGTPTSIDSKYIYQVLSFVKNNFKLRDNIEISIEGNPGTLTKEKVKTYKSLGVNRFSLGLQSLNDKLLRSIGRSHSVDDFYKSYNLLKHMGINNINLDLMFGLPNQSLEDVVNSLEKVIKLGVEHISFYGLILEEGTYLYNMYHKGLISLPSEDEEREMYHKGLKIMKENGYIHYEISNFALPGYECKHNLVYWDLKPYIGIGLSSHSSFEGKRFWNTKDISLYIEKGKKKILPIEGEEIINRSTEISEFCILGIRKIKGIDKIEFKKRFNTDIESLYGDTINKHVNNNLIKNGDNFISLTKTGLDLSNIVEVDFFN